MYGDELMKKLLLILLLVPVLTACGGNKNKLTCVNKYDLGEAKYIFYFNSEDELESGEYIIHVDYTDQELPVDEYETIEDLLKRDEEATQSFCEETDNITNCRYKRDDDVSNTLTADVKEESIKDLINDAGSNKKSAIKTFIEENERGFVCE